MIGSLYSSLRLSLVAAGLLLTLSITAVVMTALVGNTGLFDRGVLAFTSVCTSRTEGLFQIDIGHQIRVRLSNRYDNVYSLSYSPLASWLVFEAVERGAQAFGRRIYAIDLDSNREYILAPGYVSFNGTPLRWQRDGKSLELRLMGTAGSGSGMEDIVVNVDSGEVLNAVPVSAAFTALETDDSGTTFIPVSAFNAADSLNNRVDADTSAQGDVASSRRNGREFDLYIQYARNDEVTQVTQDACIERYPRWRP